MLEVLIECLERDWAEAIETGKYGDSLKKAIDSIPESDRENLFVDLQKWIKTRTDRDRQNQEQKLRVQRYELYLQLKAEFLDLDPNSKQRQTLTNLPHSPARTQLVKPVTIVD